MFIRNLIVCLLITFINKKPEKISAARAGSTLPQGGKSNFALRQQHMGLGGHRQFGQSFHSGFLKRGTYPTHKLQGTQGCCKHDHEFCKEG
jgi:hypothetical protein